MLSIIGLLIRVWLLALLALIAILFYVAAADAKRKGGSKARSVAPYAAAAVIMLDRSCVERLQRLGITNAADYRRCYRVVQELQQ